MAVERVEAETRDWFGGLPFGLFVAAPILALDQATKWLVKTEVAPARYDVMEITGFFNIVHAWNRGVTFGLGDGVVSPAILLVVAGVIVIVLLELLRRCETAWDRWAFGLVIGGALGNILDRGLHGAVFDFLDVHAAGWHWPAFNVADSAICVGVGMLVLQALFARPRKTR